MRGRYDQEGRVRQHLEIKNNDYAVNTITSVQKDALILEINKVVIEDFYKSRPVRVYDEYSPTLRSDRYGLKVIEAILKVKCK